MACHGGIITVILWLLGFKNVCSDILTFQKLFAAPNLTAQYCIRTILDLSAIHCLLRLYALYCSFDLHIFC